MNKDPTPNKNKAPALRRSAPERLFSYIVLYDEPPPAAKKELLQKILQQLRE